MQTCILDTCIMDTQIMDTCIIDTWIMDTCIIDICIVDTCIMGTCIMDTCIMDTCIMDNWTYPSCILPPGSHGLSALRPQRTKSRGPKCLQGRRLLVVHIFRIPSLFAKILILITGVDILNLISSLMAFSLPTLTSWTLSGTSRLPVPFISGPLFSGSRDKYSFHPEKRTGKDCWVILRSVKKGKFWISEF